MAETSKTWSFSEVARQASCALGTPAAFAVACLVVVVWAVTGPLFGYSNTWQLVINTGTTIITFLMIFLVQNTQNRDSRALHLKLDELLRSVDAARNRLIDLENCTDEEIDQVQRQFKALKLRQNRQASPLAEAKVANPEKNSENVIQIESREARWVSPEVGTPSKPAGTP